MEYDSHANVPVVTACTCTTGIILSNSSYRCKKENMFLNHHASVQHSPKIAVYVLCLHDVRKTYKRKVYV